MELFPQQLLLLNQSTQGIAAEFARSCSATATFAKSKKEVKLSLPQAGLAFLSESSYQLSCLTDKVSL